MSTDVLQALHCQKATKAAGRGFYLPCLQLYTDAGDSPRGRPSVVNAAHLNARDMLLQTTVASLYLVLVALDVLRNVKIPHATGQEEPEMEEEES